MKHLTAVLAAGSLLGMVSPAVAQTGSGFYDPLGGWTYVYQGDRADGEPQPGGPALDGTWTNDNNSDEWDGLGRGTGVGAPGGVDTQGGVLSIQDSTSEAFAPNSKLYFVHDVSQHEIVADDWLDAGVTFYFRARLTPGETPNGYGIFNNGKGNISLRQAGPTGGTSEGIISFSLVEQLEDASPTAQIDFGAAGLTMNRLNGDEATGSGVDSASPTGDLNLLQLNPRDFHEFWIMIRSNGDAPGTHEAIVYADGIGSQMYSFNLTAGTGDEGLAFPNYFGLGTPSTLATGALDIDFLAFRTGIHPPNPVPEPGLITLCALGGLALWTGRRCRTV